MTGPEMTLPTMLLAFPFGAAIAILALAIAWCIDPDIFK